MHLFRQMDSTWDFHTYRIGEQRSLGLKFFKKVDFEKKSPDHKKSTKNFPGGKELNKLADVSSGIEV